MRATIFLLPVFGPLTVLAANVERGLERDIHDGPVAHISDSFGDGTSPYEQWPQLGSVPVNRTVVGSPRSEKRHLNNLLEARQTDVCVDPGYILVCPTTDAFPCCDPKFPICCHTTTCCPTGTFCVGKSTCCQLGSVACDESCCPSGTTCCGVACCTAGFTCVSGTCQNLNAVTSTRATSPVTGTNTPTSTSDNDNTATPTPTSRTNNAAVIGGAVGGALGVVLICGGIAAWFFHNKKGKGPATTASSTAGTTQPQGYGWTAGGAPGTPSVGQPLMTSTTMPFTPTANSGAGFAAQSVYGASLQQPPTPSNGTDYNQPPVSQYPQSAYGAAAPSGPAPLPGYYAGTPAPSNAGGSVYGGMAAEAMQPGQGAYGGYDSSTNYVRAPSSPGPQVQTWVERPGGR